MIFLSCILLVVSIFEVSLFAFFIYKAITEWKQIHAPAAILIPLFFALLASAGLVFLCVDAIKFLYNR